MGEIVAERLRACCVLLAMLPLSGCYVLQAAAGQADVLSRSEPIEEVIADPQTPKTVRARLDIAEQARACSAISRRARTVLGV